MNTGKSLSSLEIFVLNTLRTQFLDLSTEKLNTSDLSAPAFWNECFKYATSLHAETPFLHTLSKSQIQIPDETQSEITLKLCRSRMWMGVLADELEFTLNCLESAKIPVIVLKGMDVGFRFYPERMLRPMADIDLLVRPADYLPALDILKKNGFETTRHLQTKRFRIETSRGPGQPIVELHQSLLLGYTPEWVDGFWARSVDFQVSGFAFPLRVLSPEDNLVYLIGHAGVQHLFESPIWFNDIHFLILNSPQLQWDVVFQRLEVAHHIVAGWFFFETLAAQWGTPIPERALKLSRSKVSFIKRESILYWMQRHPVFSSHPRSIFEVMISRFLMRDNWSELFRYVINRYRLR